MEPKLLQGYIEWGIARSLNMLFYEPKYNNALNVSKLNWSFVLLLLSNWFAIPPWKTLFEQNLQYPYIRGVKYFNRPLIYFV